MSPSGHERSFQSPTREPVSPRAEAPLGPSGPRRGLRGAVGALLALLVVLHAAACSDDDGDQQNTNNDNQAQVESDCGNGLDDDGDGATDCDDPDCATLPVCDPGDAPIPFTILQTEHLTNHASGSGPFLEYTPLDPADGDPVRGGFARLAGLIEEIRAQRDASSIPVVLVDSGDWFGSVYDLAPQDPITLRYFATVGYDAVVFGNQGLYWGPAALAQLIANARPDFDVPVLASNTVFSALDPRDDALAALVDEGVIVTELLLPLGPDLTLGLLGNLGQVSESAAESFAPPLDFDHDFVRWQQRVDAIRAAGADLVLLVSQGDLEDPRGDDEDLANNVTGIDVIASGNHDEVTEPMIVGSDETILYCPGRDGRYITQLDAAFDPATGRIGEFTYQLRAVDDTVAGDPAVQQLVDGIGAEIDQQLLSSIGVGMASPIAELSFDFDPGLPRETGQGNLTVDALRAVASLVAADSAVPTPYAAAFIIRDTLTAPLHRASGTGVVSFADVYNSVGEGASIDPDGPLSAGWALFECYLTPREIWLVAEALVYTFSTNPDVAAISTSGFRVDFDSTAPVLQRVAAVWLCEDALPPALGGAGDYFSTQCDTPLDPMDDTTLLRTVADNLTMAGFSVYASYGLDVEPKRADGTVINVVDPAQMLAARIDLDPATPQIEELKTWHALTRFLLEVLVDQGGIAGVNEIPTVYEDPSGAALGRYREL